MNKRFDDCEKYLKEFNSLHNVDIFKNTRKNPVIQYRQLFHTILRKQGNMSLQKIADFTTYKGRKCDHTTVMHSVKKTLETNYYAFDDIAELYDLYFNDKKAEREQKERDSYYSQQYTKRLNKLYKIEDKRFNRLVSKIPKDRVDEICDMLELRIKSWDWKTKDRCQIIESSESISNNVF